MNNSKVDTNTHIHTQNAVGKDILYTQWVRACGCRHTAATHPFTHLCRPPQKIVLIWLTHSEVSQSCTHNPPRDRRTQRITRSPHTAASQSALGNAELTLRENLGLLYRLGKCHYIKYQNPLEEVTFFGQKLHRWPQKFNKFRVTCIQCPLGTLLRKIQNHETGSSVFTDVSP